MGRSVDVGDFEAVQLLTSGDLYITQTGETSLQIEADEETLSRLTAEVRGGTLVLGARSDRAPWGVRPTGRIRYNLTVDELHGITLAGSGDIRCESLEAGDLALEILGSGDLGIDALRADELAVNIRGSGNVQVAGAVDDQEVSILGSGNFRAQDLGSDTARVQIMGSGNATVWVEDTLDVRIMGSGDCLYYGNPRVLSSELGSGDVRSMGSR